MHVWGRFLPGGYDAVQAVSDGVQRIGGDVLAYPRRASAQSASDGDKIQNLERQTEALQKQLKEIKDELARSRKKRPSSNRHSNSNTKRLRLTCRCHRPGEGQGGAGCAPGRQGDIGRLPRR